ncbi:MAG TPA: hypothetical protein VGN97_08705 [Mesorhizobium sp.]|nr:hypothetical protein [Mesorhizobium sp.]
MSHEERVFYSSENGDEWRLARGPDGTVTVRHLPNAPSGGQSASFEVAAFLAREPHSPQNKALQNLIGSFVEVQPVMGEAQGEADLLDAMRSQE